MAREMKDSGILWIGNIPSDWTTTPIKYLASYNDEVLSESVEDDFEFDYIDIGSVQNGVGITQLQHMKFLDAPSRARRVVRENDIILSTVRTYLKAVATIGDFTVPQIVSTGFIVIRAKEDKVLPAFLTYAVQSESFICTVVSHSTGISYPAINPRQVVQFKIPISHIYEQSRIASFLDHECSEIDAVLKKTRTSIEEYKKLKQAVITQTVTKGIRGDRPMKDSGIEWIGEIPAEWNSQRIKTIFSLRDERNYLPLEEVNLISLYTDKGVVQHADLEVTTGNKASNADGYKIVYENDIIVNIILCWMGAIGRSAFNGVTSPAYDVYIPSDKIDCRFYHHYFRTTGFSGDCYKRGKGIMAMRWRTYSDQFRDIRVVVPPLHEQVEILGYLDEKCAELDKLIAKKKQFLAELESYKKSLIFEYVTGKKEVI
ncbi:MAG: restriction endonuclease subunit S [Oscillospiraceae bacterium]|nr:restriction endonuclease subunit S [Oscillospiraceae bacterium]